MRPLGRRAGPQVAAEPETATNGPRGLKGKTETSFFLASSLLVPASSRRQERIAWLPGRDRGPAFAHHPRTPLWEWLFSLDNALPRTSGHRPPPTTTPAGRQEVWACAYPSDLNILLSASPYGPRSFPALPHAVWPPTLTPRGLARMTIAPLSARQRQVPGTPDRNHLCRRALARSRAAAEA